MLAGVAALGAVVALLGAPAPVPAPAPAPAPPSAGGALFPPGLPSALRVPGVLSPRIANYRIQADLDGEHHRITAKEHLSWRNTLPDPVPLLKFHLYMNAFKNEDSVFLREGRRGEGRQVKVPDKHWGSIEVKSIRLGGADLRPRATTARCGEDEPQTPDCPKDETVMDVPLPAPLLADTQIDLDIEFEVQLPEVVERSGYKDQFHMVGQWFPKIGVWEKGPDGAARWNCHQFHADSEFFADFGEYLVELTVPKGYVVGASGVLAEERAAAGGKRTLVYHAEDVHDFAWTADPRYRVAHEKWQDVDVTVLYHAGDEHGLPREFASAGASLELLGQIAFPYPYRTLTIVEPPMAAFNAGGMEYPTLITSAPGIISWLPGPRAFDEVTVHEFGHQYWYGMLASNEFEEPWLDEGVNTYGTALVLEKMFGRGRSAFDLFGLAADAFTDDRLSYSSFATYDALETFAWRFSPGHYWLVYGKTAVALRTLEGYLGHDRMMAALGHYARRFRFQHPRAQDFFDAFAESTGSDLMWFFRPAFLGTEVLDYEISDVSSQRARPALGLFDRDGKRVEVKESDRKDKSERYDCDILVHRVGDFRFPVEIEVHFEDGQVERTRWDGQERWRRLKLTHGAPIAWATVDPEHKILLDVDWLNDGLRHEPDTRPARRMHWSLAFWVQNLLQAVAL